MQAIIELFRFFLASAHGNRQWGALSTPRRMPVDPFRHTGLTKGCFFNCGGGTGGFKANPGFGRCLRLTLANRSAPCLWRRRYSIDRFTRLLMDEHGPRRKLTSLSPTGSWTMFYIHCPYCASDGSEEEVSWHGPAHIQRRKIRGSGRQRMGDYCSSATNPEAASGNCGWLRQAVASSSRCPQHVSYEILEDVSHG